MKTSTLYATPAFLAFMLITLGYLFFTPCTAQTVFYGMTAGGGTNGVGAIIRFNPVTNTDSVVWNFAGKPTDGASPRGNLVYDTINGLFYGMARNGGNEGNGAGDGIIFTFNPSNDSENAVWNFGNGTDGAGPYGSLVYDAANGLFYGMTQSGGINDSGTIFKFNPTTNKDSVIWSANMKSGYAPLRNLVYDATNKLFYGMTFYGGTNDGGTIISLNPLNNAVKALWNFGNGTDGLRPYGSLVLDATNQLLYGMTAYGGSNSDGTIFSFNTSTNRDSVLVNLPGKPSDGETPQGNLVYDPGNKLYYGMSYYGGSNEIGSIISFNPVTNKDSLVWSFGSGEDGVAPVNDLVYDEDKGLFYGMVATGGSIGNDGVIISFNPVNDSEKVLWDFGSGTDGLVPFGNLVLYTSNGMNGIKTITHSSFSINIYPNPTDGNFTITGLSNSQTIELYNYAGQKMTSLKTENTTEQIDISNKANGIYLVRIANADGTLFNQRKIIKIN